jgi:cytochrome P450
MDASAMLVALLTILAAAAAAAVASSSLRRRKNQPPGSLGLPVVGHTLALLRALRSNAAEDWLRRRAAAYGPVSTISLFGRPTAFLAGASCNKLLFSSDKLAAMSSASFLRMVGRRNIREVAGDDHRRVRAMMARFLRLDAVKNYVSVMDDEVRRHLRAEWGGRAAVAVMPSMKSLTFDVMCTVLFGLERRGDHAAVRRELSSEFQQLVRGIWAVPVNLPFTTFGKCLAASRRGRRAVARIVEERRRAMPRGGGGGDLVTHMLAEGMDEEEIIDNVVFLMVAAHDTTAVLLTFLLRHLDGNRAAYERVAAEQEAIATQRRRRGGSGSGSGSALTWDDLAGMRYTWAAAMETLRMVPPTFANMRKAVADVEVGGYVIPKGWQVITAATMTHLDPAIFPDPGRFEPARFEAAAAKSAPPPFSYVPFGGGARACPGNEFARAETLVAMHYIVTGFRWRLAAGCDGGFSRHPLPCPNQGLLLDIEPKEYNEL